MRKFIFVFLAAIVVLSIGGAAAQAAGREPGSLLVFPLYDSRPGVSTLLTVTNTNPSEAVYVEYRYIDGRSCQKSDRTELLTPNDTLTVVAFNHNFDRNVGYVYVYAKTDINSGSPAIVHNWLVGEASMFDGIRVLEASYNAFSFAGVGNDGDLTDDDNDEWLDLDGVEYEMAADHYIQPRFIGQADGDEIGFDSRLVLINLTGGTQFTADIDFHVFNDNEQPLSASHTFDCFWMGPLLEISGAFSTTALKYQDDDEEILGIPDLESGWFWIQGVAANSQCDTIDDPAILHMLIETTGRTFAGADLPFESVEKQNNGDLLPRSCFGE